MKLIKKYSLDKENKVKESSGSPSEVMPSKPLLQKTADIKSLDNNLVQPIQSNLTPVKKEKFYQKLKFPKLRLKKFFRKSTVIILIVLIVLGALLTHFLILPGFRIKNSVDIVQDELNKFAADLANKDVSKIDTYFNSIQIQINKISEEVEQYDFLKNLDATKGYYENFQIGRNILRKVDTLIEDYLPETKGILASTGFNVEKNPVEKTDEEKEEDSTFNLIMKQLPAYINLYTELEPEFLDILSEVEKINPAYIPSIGDLSKIREFIPMAREIKLEIPEKSKQILDFVKQVPDLIGSGTEKNYMVILQNETEMRSSGGLITAFGGMKFKDGEMGDIFLTDSWNIETYVSYDLGIDVGYRNIYGQLTLMGTGCGGYYLRAQDAGIYPDLNVTMNMFKDYYDVANRYNKSDYPDYDYIVILNNAFAEGLIDLIQPLEVPGFGQVTADGLYDFIKQDTDSVENRGSADRKKIVEEIGDAAKKRISELGFEKLPQFLNLILKGFYAHDLAISSPKNEELQIFLDKYDLSGKFAKEFDGDYFHMNEAQNCSLKLNRWVRDSVQQEINIDDNGNIHKSIWVKWEQPKVYEERYENQYSGSLNFSYRAWVRFMVPPSVQSLNSDGYYHSGYLYYYPFDYYDEVMNKTVSDNIIQFDHRRWSEEDPVQTQDINVDYSLPAELNYDAKGEYKMLVQKHPGKSWGEPYHIIINHKGERYEVDFVLDQDKVLTYKNGSISVDNYNKELDFILDLSGKIEVENNSNSAE